MESITSAYQSFDIGVPTALANSSLLFHLCVVKSHRLATVCIPFPFPKAAKCTWLVPQHLAQLVRYFPIPKNELALYYIRCGGGLKLESMADVNPCFPDSLPKLRTCSLHSSSVEVEMRVVQPIAPLLGWRFALHGALSGINPWTITLARRA